jgi:DNA-binding transcriptional ArsR family regulator
MEAVLWYVLTGTRGGPNRARILRAIDDRPRNANRLAEDLDLDYKTIRHHLDVLGDNGIVVTSGDDYGAIYMPSERVRQRWGTVETVLEAAMESEGSSGSDAEADADTDTE